MGKENGFNHDYGDNDNDNVSGIGKKVLLLFRAQEEDPQKNGATDSSGHQEEREFGSKDRIIARA